MKKEDGKGPLQDFSSALFLKHFTEQLRTELNTPRSHHAGSELMFATLESEGKVWVLTWESEISKSNALRLVPFRVWGLISEMAPCQNTATKSTTHI